MNDPLRQIYEHFVQWCQYMPDERYGMAFRLMVIWALPTILCGWAFWRGSRSILIQTLCLTVGVFVAFVIPLGEPPRNEHVKAFIFAISCVLLFFLPAILPFFLTGIYGVQIILRVMFYLGTAVAALVWTTIR